MSKLLVLFWLLYPLFPALAMLSWLLCPCLRILAVLSWLSCPSCSPFNIEFLQEIYRNTVNKTLQKKSFHEKVRFLAEIAILAYSFGRMPITKRHKNTLFISLNEYCLPEVIFKNVIFVFSAII